MRQFREVLCQRLQCLHCRGQGIGASSPSQQLGAQRTDVAAEPLLQHAMGKHTDVATKPLLKHAMRKHWILSANTSKN